MPEEVEFELTVLERLAKRYGTRKGLWGIEVLNEPATREIWDVMKVKERYPAVDPQMAEGSKPNSLEFIRQFYLDAYGRMRKYMPEEKYIVIHDAFQLKTWKDFMQEEQYKGVVLDTHMYLMEAELRGCEKSVEGYVKWIRENYEANIREMEKYFPVVCGEWCLFNSLAAGKDTKGGQLGSSVQGEERILDDKEKKEIYNAVADAQLEAWRVGSGYFYWNYKLNTDVTNTAGWLGWDCWDLGRCVDFGWFPVQK